MRILAIDPGPKESAYLVWVGKVSALGTVNNDRLLQMLTVGGGYDEIAIETIACYGMAVGAEVFETVIWIGRFIERCEVEPRLVKRLEVKLHHCHSARAKDSNVRQALLDRFGGREVAVGKKNAPGPLYGVKKHLWSALAIALYAADNAEAKKQ